MDYTAAIKEITANRRREADAAEALKQKLIDTDMRFYENERALRLAGLKELRGEKVDTKKLLAERKEILKAHGLSPISLDPPPSCKACNDTGYVGGKLCRCVIKKSLESEQGSAKGKFALSPRYFSDIDLSVYSQKSRPIMEKIKGKLEKYVAGFPEVGVKNLIFTGHAGSGKTFAATAVAGEVMQKGYTAAIMTAFGFVENMRAYHTTFDDSKESYPSPVLDCDLLVIDDLGTESILKNITLEYLYLVLNERMISGKHTLVTTNLTPNDLASRYGERTASRLFDKRVAYAVPFPDEDLRDAIKRK